jgi:hypothetical protein
MAPVRTPSVGDLARDETERAERRLVGLKPCPRPTLALAWSQHVRSCLWLSEQQPWPRISALDDASESVTQRDATAGVTGNPVSEPWIGELRLRIVLAPPAVPRANVSAPLRSTASRMSTRRASASGALVFVEKANPAISDGSRPGGVSNSGRYCSLAAAMISRWRCRLSGVAGPCASMYATCLDTSPAFARVLLACA